MSISAYRGLWRATRIAFKVGDDRVLSAARQQIRQGFRDQAALVPSDPSVGPAIQKAEDIARLLRENVVQGIRDDPHTYKLRIHKNIERGDNDTIKTAGGGGAFTGRCGCS
ncbi:Mitochondrial zinc maintenance protein 1 [Colletotrichum sidae]|uniref:Mitochondrial zinc maintenance protein 1, mitochondrial n=1 Tax=Colletotrichum sidae TaxID=1347389 RepID=A0A4R8T2Y4_9PEZI|nr:Mitochondrial zinc maintenance protein 1 [Colletotrichum sidae]